ncbi:MAG: 50S ribosomal protein L21 [Clostridia bacterium]|nr:50S ribosomal protein L21 [Clostridia bacterium]MBR1677189.1 50S ribosomal protein L21 [Clostridia bacterium]
MYAIIENGSKQYKVAVDDVVFLEKIDAGIGEKVKFDVLLVSDENGIKVGGDAAAYKATAEVLENGKGKKVIVYKYKAKKNERRKHGHRQPFTKVKIVGIDAE